MLPNVGLGQVVKQCVCTAAKQRQNVRSQIRHDEPIADVHTELIAAALAVRVSAQTAQKALAVRFCLAFVVDVLDLYTTASHADIDKRCAAEYRIDAW